MCGIIGSLCRPCQGGRSPPSTLQPKLNTASGFARTPDSDAAQIDHSLNFDFAVEFRSVEVVKRLLAAGMDAIA
jgi:hypothetical protein